MTDHVPTADMREELAAIALSMQAERTGHMPKAVTVVASEDTVVLTLYDALTPAEKILAITETGAAKVEQYHRALFAVSCDELRKEVRRLTGRRVREARDGRLSVGPPTEQRNAASASARAARR